MANETPVIFEHCLVAWRAMVKESIAADGYNPDTDLPRLWRGSLTKLFEEEGLGISRYTMVTNLLKQMDCIFQRRRGGGTTPSEWVLLKEPDLDEYTKTNLQDAKMAGKRGNLVDQRINDLTQRLNVAEQRIDEMEAKLGA